MMEPQVQTPARQNPCLILHRIETRPPVQDPFQRWRKLPGGQSERQRNHQKCHPPGEPSLAALVQTNMEQFPEERVPDKRLFFRHPIGAASGQPATAAHGDQLTGGYAPRRFIKRSTFEALVRFAQTLLGIRGNWQGRRDSNSQPPVLETGALPIELHPYCLQRLFASFTVQSDRRLSPPGRSKTSIHQRSGRDRFVINRRSS